MESQLPDALLQGDENFKATDLDDGEEQQAIAEEAQDKHEDKGGQQEPPEDDHAQKASPPIPTDEKDVYDKTPVEKPKNKRLHKKSIKYAGRIASLSEDKKALQTMMSKLRSKEKLEKQRMRRMWKKASKLDMPTLMEISEMKGLTSEAFKDLDAINAPASSSGGAAKSSKE